MLLASLSHLFSDKLLRHFRENKPLLPKKAEQGYCTKLTDLEQVSNKFHTPKKWCYWLRWNTKTVKNPSKYSVSVGTLTLFKKVIKPRTYLQNREPWYNCLSLCLVPLSKIGFHYFDILWSSIHTQFYGSCHLIKCNHEIWLQQLVLIHISRHQNSTLIFLLNIKKEFWQTLGTSVQ